MDIDLRQFDETPSVSREDWQSAVAKALGTLTLEKIAATTRDGIAVQPLAPPPQADRDPLPGRGAGVPWSIVQRVTVADAAVANADVLSELQAGATAVDLVISQGTANALLSNTATEEDKFKLVRVLQGVYLNMVSVHLTCPAVVLAVARNLLDAVSSKADLVAGATFHFGYDPIASFVSGFADSPRYKQNHYALTDIFQRRAQYRLGGTVLSSHGQIWHAAGASEAQQLAIALATTVEYLRTSLSGEVKPSAEEVARAIEIRLIADQNQFLTTAKIRAFRRLWALVLDEFGLPQTPAFIHAETAHRMLTRRDPWVNIIRSTIAAVGAALGGADAITTVPHSMLLGLPDAAARRLSRNVQTIVMEESNLHRVADPAAGAYGQEALADDLAEKAWAEFQAIEREGGLIASVEGGSILSRIAAVEDKTREAVARRRVPITGTSTYPLLGEDLPDVLGPWPEGDEPATAPLKPVRIAESWERLRDRGDGPGATRPTLFLANLGPVAAFTARATWAKNLFEAAGIETAARDGHRTTETLVDAFRASGSPIACLCSDDATYAARAVETAAALKGAGATMVFLAGRPGALEADLKAAGVDRFVHEGLDMLALLNAVHDDLNSPKAG